jgi:hypothetical protein
MEDKLQYYRQPMVTTIGIFLGFVLNVASGWITNAFAGRRLKEIVTAIGLCACIILLLIVLYRILRMDYPKEKAGPYYRKTLFLLITAFGVAFLSIFIVMIESFIINR